MLGHAWTYALRSGGMGGGQERCCRSFDARPRGGQASFARTWGHAGEAASLVEA